MARPRRRSATSRVSGVLLASCCALHVACARAGAPPPTPRSPVDRADPAPQEAGAGDEPRFVLPPVGSAVPPVPRACDVYVRTTVAASADAAACADGALAAALDLQDPDARDAALAHLEPCSTWAPGVLRALRAELAPAECGDVLVEDFLTTHAEHPDGEIARTLFALGVAGRLRRLATQPPAPPEAHDRAALEAYFQNELFPWIGEQSSAIHQLAERGASLKGYPRGIVAVEAGMADMRFVEIARGVPIPADMQEDAELRDTYYASLDEALEPRKRRGRDAALVGLNELAETGALADARVTAARGLLSRVYGGRRIDALDRLLLPPLPPLEPAEAASRIAAHVPTFYVAWLLPEAEVRGDLLRAFLERGLPRSVQLDLGSRPLDTETALLLARGHIDIGRTYFRAESFATARRLLEAHQGVEAEFLSALATALMAGPRDAVEMFARGPYFAKALGNLEDLDAVSDAGGPLAGPASFAGAYLRELVAPAEDPAYWQDLSRRYDRAAQGLAGTQKNEALARAEAARATASAIGRRASGRGDP